MQGYPGQPGQRRPAYFEFTDVRLQNRTVWVFSGACIPRALILTNEIVTHIRGAIAANASLLSRRPEV